MENFILNVLAESAHECLKLSLLHSCDYTMLTEKKKRLISPTAGAKLHT